MRGDLPALLDLAVDHALSLDMVATIAPLAGEDGDVTVVRAVHDHPNCSAGIASRYATHPVPAIRVRVACFPGLTTSGLAILAIDPNEQVRAAAATALADRAGTTFGD